MNKTKKCVSCILALIIVVCSLSFSPETFSASANILLTKDEISAKHYPVPNGYKVKTIFATYDTESQRGTYSESRYSVSHSTVEGTYYDKGSAKITSKNASLEIGTLSQNVNLDGSGFMFWYKSDYSTDFRFRMSNNEIMYYGSLPACPEGQWVTYYYYGKIINANINSSSKHKDIRSYLSNSENKFKMNLMYGTSEERTIFIDEFFTFDAIETPADSYTTNEEMLKFSLANMSKETKTIGQYSDDGSVVLTSEYGSTTSNSPISVEYNLNSDRAENAIEIAKKGSGYLKLDCSNISCHNSAGADSYAKITMTINGVDKKLEKYSFGSGSTDTYLIKVSDIETPKNATSITINITGSSIKDVAIKFSPITVFHFQEDEIILQAEDLSPKHKTSEGVISNADIFDEVGNNRRYVYVNSAFWGKYLSFDLPELEVGEYDVYASCYLTKDYTSKYNICVNNLKQINDVVFTDPVYASKRHNVNVAIGKIKISKAYADGSSILKFVVAPKSNESIYIDYFSFTKTDKTVQTEPKSNFEIKSYPEIENHEVKTILNTFDDYICGGDDRYYQNIQVAGYIGDGNAFNLNSRGTINKGFFDGNSIWSSETGLDGDGIRFWYKAQDNAEIQFKSSGTIVYNYKIPANKSGGWVTLFYKNFVSNGDFSKITNISLKTSSSNGYYVDELHTIQEALGDVEYQLNGDGTASVTGYNLRLEDVVIKSEYMGCPVTTIKEGALSETTNLKSIVLPDTITKIEKDAFKNDLNLSKVTFGKNIKSIGENAFNNCEKLGNVLMPESISTIDSTSFSQCDLLVMEVLNDTYSKSFAISNNIKYRCESNQFTYICENNVITIETYNGSSNNVAIPDMIDNFTVENLGTNCFKNNLTLEIVSIPDSVKQISNAAFSGCSSLKKVNMSLNVENIYDESFINCTALKEISLGEKLLKIGKNAFENCSSISKLKLNPSITSIDVTSFSGCDSLVADVILNSYAYKFVNENSILQIPSTESKYKYSLTNYSATLIGYEGSETTLKIPSVIDNYKVIAIGKNAFSYNNKLTYIYFPEFCKTVEENAFLKCSSLTGFDINDVRTIKAYAFGYCASLGNVKITNVVSYSEYAFVGCTKLKLEVEKTQFQRTAMELCNSWHVGFNLGNTFDSSNVKYTYGMLTPTQQETLWGAPVTTKEMIDYLAKGGFDVLRLPVTWSAFIDDNNNYTIDPNYLARIKQIVDWCISNDMYVVLNVHHDTTTWLDLRNFSVETCNKFKRVWEQISTYFKDYDEHLIFESLNEARAGEDWDGNSRAGLFTDFNTLQKIFYETVRKTGGYNDVRYLMLETYGAQAKQGHCSNVWYPSLEEDNHIMLSTHFYTNNIGEGNFTYNLGVCKKYFTDKGIPCVLGETGMQNYAPNYDEEHSRWADAVMNVAEDCGLKILFWDDHGGFQMFKRTSLEWQWPTQIKTIMEHAYAKEHVDDPVDVVYGDVNNDGMVNLKDLLYLKKYLANCEIEINKTNADINKSNEVDIGDVLVLSKYLAKIITSFENA